MIQFCMELFAREYKIMLFAIFQKTIHLKDIPAIVITDNEC